MKPGLPIWAVAFTLTNIQLHYNTVTVRSGEGGTDAPQKAPYDLGTTNDDRRRSESTSVTERDRSDHREIESNNLP